MSSTIGDVRQSEARLRPVFSGRYRSLYSWAPGVFVAAGVMAVSVVLYALVRERVVTPAH